MVRNSMPFYQQHMQCNMIEMISEMAKSEVYRLDFFKCENRLCRIHVNTENLIIIWVEQELMII
jgi:hypothetical protein